MFVTDEMAEKALDAQFLDELGAYSYRIRDLISVRDGIFEINAMRAALTAALASMESPWFQGIPEEPGIYRVTGFCLDEPRFIAVVEVGYQPGHTELMHNLHRENSGPTDDWRSFRRMNRGFWWQRVDVVPLPAPPAAVENRDV